MEAFAADEIAMIHVMNRVVRRSFLMGTDELTGKNYNHRKAWVANFEDENSGTFWQSRYKAVRLIDDEALLACAAYVNLNPIRAAMAQTIEDSQFTSAQLQLQTIVDADTLEGTVEGTVGSAAVMHGAAVHATNLPTLNSVQAVDSSESAKHELPIQSGVEQSSVPVSMAASTVECLTDFPVIG